MDAMTRAVDEAAREIGYIFKERNTMYEHTVTVTFTTSRELDAFQREALCTSATQIAWGIGIGTLPPERVDLTSVEKVNPHAQIDYGRLQHYHAIMRDAGFTNSRQRAMLRRALDINVDVASHMTNAELDRLIAFLDDA